MKRMVNICLIINALLILGLAGAPARGSESRPVAEVGGFAGSRSCRQCHESFYQLWSTSFHGLAMQPYTAEFAAAKLTPQKSEIAIGKKSSGRTIARAGYEAFVANPFPPEIVRTDSLIRSLSDADRRIGQLSGEGVSLSSPRRT